MASRLRIQELILTTIVILMMVILMLGQRSRIIALNSEVDALQAQIDPTPPKEASDFALAFCKADEDYIRGHVSMMLAIDIAQVEPGGMFDSDWDCTAVEKYLGYGILHTGATEYYFRLTFSTNSPAYGFTFQNGYVTGIE